MLYSLGGLLFYDTQIHIPKKKEKKKVHTQGFGSVHVHVQYVVTVVFIRLSAYIPAGPSASLATLWPVLSYHFQHITHADALLIRYWINTMMPGVGERRDMIFDWETMLRWVERAWGKCCKGAGLGLSWDRWWKVVSYNFSCIWGVVFATYSFLRM